MASPRERRICPTCGRFGYCEDHHPLGEVHAPTVTIPSCVAECHPVATERQRRAGVTLEHDEEHPFAEKLWAFNAGLSDLLVLSAYHNPRFGEPEARAIERSAVALGRLTDKASRAAGEAGIQGPDPRGNAIRIARRRRSRNPDHSFPSRPQPFDPEAAGDRIGEIFAVLGDATAAMPQVDGLDDMKQLADLVCNNFGHLSQRFDELEAQGRSETLARCIAVGVDHRQAATEAFESVENLDDASEITPIIQRYTAYITRYFAFTVELCEASDVHEAEAALDRFASAVVAQ